MTTLLLALTLGLAVVKVEAPSPATQPTTAPATQPVLPATVVAVHGKAVWRAAAGARWQPVVVDDALPEGAELRTSVRAEVHLRLADGRVVTIDRFGSIQLKSELIHAGQLDADSSRLRKNYGRVRYDLAALSQRQDRKFTPATHPATQPVMPATVIAVQGNVQFRSQPKHDWAALERGTPLVEGSAIRVNTRSTVTLLLVGGNSVTIDQPGQYELIQDHFDGSQFLSELEVAQRRKAYEGRVLGVR